MVSCEAIPLQRLGGVLRHPLAIGVHDAEIELRDGDALVSCEAKPLQRLGVVLRHAPTLAVHEAEIVLRAGDTLVGKRTHKPQRGSVVAPVICSVSILKGACRHG